MYISSKTVLFVTVIFHCLIFGKPLEAKTLFMSMAMLNNVQFTMTQLMPRLVSLGVESLISLGRIGDFLLAKEFSPSDKLEFTQIHKEVIKFQENTQVNKQTATPVDKSKLLPQLSESRRDKQTVCIEYREVCAHWHKAETQTLDRITFTSESPGLIMICGQVASGKSSLLMSLLNELPIASGSARVQGSCSYASQTPWIFNGTVKENIVFGHGYQEARYRRVVEACALRRDFDLLDHGDLTYIQEDSLSGGQKARVNLARCLYRESDIYLLDDPFSAIDGRVADHIFEEAICRFLSGKLILLATHKVSLVPQSTKVLLLDEGKQFAYCHYSELLESLKELSGNQMKRFSFIVDELNESNQTFVKTARCPARGDSFVDDKDKKFDEIATRRPREAESSLIQSVTDGGERRMLGENLLAPDCARNFNAPVQNAHEQYGEILELQLIDRAKSALGKQDGNLESHSENKHATPKFTAGTKLEKDNKAINDSIIINGRRERSPTVAEAPTSGRRLQPLQAQHTDKTPITGNEPPTTNLKATNEDGGSKELSTREVSCSTWNLSFCEVAGSVSDGFSDHPGGGANQVCSLAAHYRPTMRTSQQILPQQESQPIKSRDNIHSRMKGGKRAQVYEERLADKGNRRPGGGPVDEGMPTNKVPGASIWYKYYTQTSAIRLLLLILTFLITQALFSTIDIYLTVWSLVEQNKALVIEITGSNQQQLETFKHEAYISQRPITNVGNMTNIITYDTSASKLPLLMSLSPSEYNCTDRIVDIGDGTQKASILPLSSRSSHKPFQFSPSVLLVLPRARIPALIANLLYFTNGGVRSPPNRMFDGHGGFAIGRDNVGGSSSNSMFFGNEEEQQHQNELNQTTLSSSNRTKAPTSRRNFLYGYDSEPTVVDVSILEESDEALNVKSIYRPLYLIVNNFTSGHHAITYAILLMVLFSFSAVANVFALTSSNKSAISLYKKLIDSALFAKLAFFDRNPVGRFLNRATRDIGIIDEAIPYNANQAYDAILQTAATFIVAAVVDITLALPSLIILSLSLIYHSIHVEPTKDIQRLEGISRSPIITHVSTTLTGLHTIRATKAEHRFEQSFMRHQDINTSRLLLHLGSNRCMAVVLDWLNAIFIATIVLWVLISGLTGPSAGLIITNAMLLCGLTQHGMTKLTETESLMTSVERVIEYCGLPQEEDGGFRRAKGNVGNGPSAVGVISDGGSVWPSRGCVEYKHVDLYYNRLDKPVLKNISFKLNSGEKVGIIGRTGAGKSSIITTLFRLYDFDGAILIDGVDIKGISLTQLRSAIGIIPQTPVLFSTTVRKNLDPFNSYDDFSLWAALDKAHLRTTVSALPGKLDYNIGNGGLSSGQKQLMCLARVLLRQNSIIVLDEATANVDPSTDAIIQTTIRSEFKHCTIITVAHRLETILDCDRIMVLEAGRIVDFDTPERLAAKSNGYFVRLLRKSTEDQQLKIS